MGPGGRGADDLFDEGPQAVKDEDDLFSEPKPAPMVDSHSSHTHTSQTHSHSHTHTHTHTHHTHTHTPHTHIHTVFTTSLSPSLPPLRLQQLLNQLLPERSQQLSSPLPSLPQRPDLRVFLAPSAPPWRGEGGCLMPAPLLT